MNPITKIDESLSIYKNNKVILWGTGHESKGVYQLLTYFEVKIFAYCDNNPDLWGNRMHCGEIPVLSPEQLKEMIQHGDSVMIQIAFDIKKNDKIERQLKNLGMHIYVTKEEMYEMLYSIKRLQICQNVPDLPIKRPAIIKGFIHNNMWKYITTDKNSELLLHITPTKSGSSTIKKTLQTHRIPYVECDNEPVVITPKIKQALNQLYSRIKVITIVREPIGQNLSLMYQYIGDFSTTYNEIFECLGKTLFQGGDQQEMFECYLDGIGYMNETKIVENTTFDETVEEKDFNHHIQKFIPKFQTYIFDIMKVPFDKEKGYSIIKEGNIEVFVCQLEKMNTNISALAEFVGADFTTLEIDNVANDKWLANSYNEAKKELKITQEYFDKCFNEPYVKHFYSEEDIKKFKRKWEKNIR